MQITKKDDPSLIFEVEVYRTEEASGQFNLGEPPASYEITAVYWNNGTNIVDMTSFLVEYADFLFPRWEEDLLD